MKKYILLIGFILLSPFTHAKVTIGEAAPDFTLTDTYGVSHSLSKFKGKTVILEWTNHQCPFVEKHYDSQNMQTLQKTYTNEGVIWLSINSSAKGKQGHVDSQEANALTKNRGASPSFVLNDANGKVGRLYDAKTTPHMYIIDKSGTLVYNGAIDSIRSADKADIKTATNYISQAMSELNAGKPISTPLTRPYGCSVKY